MAAEKQDNWSSEVKPPPPTITKINPPTNPRTTKAYQHSASFVPKLATKIMQWLDPQPDDVILDIGCGGTPSLSTLPVNSPSQSLTIPHQPDGVLDLQIGHILSRGTGSLHGIDSSPAMIAAAEKAAVDAGLRSKCTFQG